MTGTELLLWAKGPGFVIAMVIFLAGLAIRIFEIVALGRKPDLAKPRGNARAEGWNNVFRRFLPAPGMMELSPMVHIAGYIFHIGFFIALLAFIPHIHLFKQVIGFAWPGLPNGVVGGITLVTLFAMIAVLISRLRDPVRKLISTFEDYLTWAVTFLPLLTGYLAVNRLLLDIETMLGLHILSVELLLALAPFTKLMHAFTWVFARYYSGAIAGRKGAHS